jgi:hypothetical protein
VYVSKRLAAGAKEIIVRTVDPTSGLKASTFTRKVVEETDVEAMGKTVPAIKWIVETDAMPGVTSDEFVDTSGVTVRSSTSMGGLVIETVLADKDIATSKLDAPELMVSTLVEPDQPIGEPRTTKRGRYVLRVPNTGPEIPDLPTSGSQRTERIDSHSVRVLVDVRELVPADPVDAVRDAYVKPSSFIGSTDPKIVELVGRATRKLEPGAGHAQHAEALRRFVHSYISKKTLGVGFATASEVARTRSGDCSEHGVLLCAMLRAAGIPARTVSGLIYADSFAGRERVFGYHMWTQALLTVDGTQTWVDLDATLGDDTPTDATHISLGVSDMADGMTENSLISLTPLLGRVSISVESVE